MKIKPVLDKWEIKGIQHISTRENRALVEHKIPGLAGSILQDMGEVPTSIIIEGTLPYGDDLRDKFLEEVRKKFVAGEPVLFMADITTATDVKEVIIEDLQITELAGSPAPFRYLIKLKEYVPPPTLVGDATANVQKDVEIEANLAIQGKTEDIKAEGILADVGLDVNKINSFMNNVTSDKLNSFLDALGPQGLDKFGEMIKDLGLDAVNQLAKSLGINLPLGGYKKVEEVLRDLVEGVEKMVNGESGSWAPTMGITFGKIVGKLLLTVVRGDEEEVDWGRLTNTFKKALGDIFS